MKPQISLCWVLWLGVQLQIHEDYFIAEAASKKRNSGRVIALRSCLCCVLLASFPSLTTQRGLMYSQRNQVLGVTLVAFLDIPLLLYETSEHKFTGIWQRET